MKILTLFLALFLTLLPESVPVSPYSQGQEVCWEEVNDVEEEAVIRTVQRSQKGIQVSSAVSSDDGRRPVPVQVFSILPVRFCFEKQWLTACRLRL